MYLWLAVILPVLTGAVVQDYCRWESFNASCPDGHVILMKSAMYGRMRVGRCITIDYQMGCSSNVLDHTDEMCSGRQNCSIRIPDPSLDAVQPCRDDLVAYFEADYSCIPVINPLLSKDKKTFCRGTIDISSNSSGFIASSVTASSQLGSRQCPWKIKVKPGQRINITIYDFTVRSSESTPKTAPPGVSPNMKKPESKPKPCPVHAILEERDNLLGSTGLFKEVTVCGAEGRRRWLDTTKGNSLMVKMVNVTHATAQSVNFLLRYEVIGCPDIERMPMSVIERKGDSLMVSCNHTQETWHLVCKGTHWIGEYHNCSTALNKISAEEAAKGEQGFPIGLLIAIAIGVVVGVVLGFVFLIFIFICRRRSRQRAKRDPLMGGSPPEDPQNIYRLVEVRPPPLMCECQYTPGSDHKNFGTMDNKMNLPPPPSEFIYHTQPRFDAGENPYQSRDNDIYQPQNITPLKTCDIISDINVPDNNLQCCSPGQDCLPSNNCVRAQNAHNENTYPRIKPFPGFNNNPRGTLKRVQIPTAGELENTSSETNDQTLYHPR